MAIEDELLPRCPHYLNDEIAKPAYFYETYDCPRCKGCPGLGVYEDVHGAVRVCDFYQKWMLSRTHKK
jgi:hypothetical protein